MRNETGVELPGSFEGSVAFQREERQGVFSLERSQENWDPRGSGEHTPPEREREAERPLGLSTMKISWEHWELRKPGPITVWSTTDLASEPPV